MLLEKGGIFLVTRQNELKAKINRIFNEFVPAINDWKLNRKERILRIRIAKDYHHNRNYK